MNSSVTSINDSSKILKQVCPAEPPITKQKLQLLDKFETMYQRLGGPNSIQNPFAEQDASSDINTLWKNLGNNKMLGILHGFVLLRPLIKDAIEREEHNIVKKAMSSDENEAKLLSEMAMKVDYLSSVVAAVADKNTNE